MEYRKPEATQVQLMGPGEKRQNKVIGELVIVMTLRLVELTTKSASCAQTFRNGTRIDRNIKRTLPKQNVFFVLRIGRPVGQKSKPLIIPDEQKEQARNRNPNIIRLPSLSMETREPFPHSQNSKTGDGMAPSVISVHYSLLATENSLSSLPLHL
uniref:Uncharacterized protein n=1 Tax=Salix viminalis TaxID=40686 RepID=A0A6N2KUJ5_SALVM